MREIKFRAWDAESNKMSTPFYLDELSYHPVIGNIEVLDLDKSITSLIIMQYTGLKDKNGKEIYEGDIINHEVWLGSANGGMGIEKRVVTYGEHSEDSRDAWWLGWNITRPRNIEVIGNIYENKELLNR